MLFPKLDQQTRWIIGGVALGLILTALVVVLIALNQTLAVRALAAATPTATKTPTPKPTATFTPTSTPTPTFTPTSTPTSTSTPMPTDTPTPTATPTFTPEPPTFTPTFTPPPPPSAEPATPVAVVPPETMLTATVTLTGTASLTDTGVITPVAPLPPTATPLPRTVAVPAGLPDYTQVPDHLWFTRPFTAAYPNWGSFYYPYGTNAGGKYFWHFGIDVQSFGGQPIVAVGDGVVVHSGPDTTPDKQLGPWPDFYGQAVVLQHQSWEGKPVYTLYGHVSKVLVQVGQPVKAGQIIALVGGLGVATGPHLHLEVRVGGTTYYDTRNPDLWVRPDPGYGVIAGRVVDAQNFLVPVQLVTLHRANESNRFWRQTFTYPDKEVNSDDKLLETFTFADVPAGQYLLKTTFDGRQLMLPVTVKDGATSFVELKQTQAPKAQPAPVAASPTDQPTPENTQPQ